MTSAAKHKFTAGPWNYSPIKRGTLDLASGEVSEMKPAGFAITAVEPKMFGGTRILEADISEDHARLIAEAGTVLHETGLTPRQLAERCKELETALRDMAMAYGHPDDPDARTWWEHRAEDAAEQGRSSDWYLNEVRAQARAALAKAEGGAA